MLWQQNYLPHNFIIAIDLMLLQRQNAWQYIICCHINNHVAIDLVGTIFIATDLFFNKSSLQT